MQKWMWYDIHSNSQIGILGLIWSLSKFWTNVNTYLNSSKYCYSFDLNFIITEYLKKYQNWDTTYEW